MVQEGISSHCSRLCLPINLLFKNGIQKKSIELTRKWYKKVSLGECAWCSRLHLHINYYLKMKQKKKNGFKTRNDSRRYARQVWGPIKYKEVLEDVLKEA